MCRVAILLSLCCLLLADELQPGRVARIAFPELPTTLAGNEAAMLVRLPTGYRAGRSYPVFCWLNGGRGLPSPPPFLIDDDCIYISLPLFKAIRQQGTALTAVDLGINRRAHQRMLARLDELVGDIDRDRSILGGFSNGGHCIALLSRCEEIMARYRGIMLCDGGPDFQIDRRLHAGKELLVIVGERSGLAERMRRLATRCGRRDMHAVFVSMPGLGHHMPTAEQHPVIRLWAGERLAPPLHSP